MRVARYSRRFSNFNIPILPPREERVNLFKAAPRPAPLSACMPGA